MTDFRHMFRCIGTAYFELNHKQQAVDVYQLREDSPLLVCNRCGKVKHLSEFKKLRHMRRQPCKVCVSEATLRWYYLNKNRQAKRMRAYHRKHSRAVVNSHRRDPSSGQYYCPMCRKMKRIEEFYRNKAAPSGRSSYCAECIRQQRGTVAIREKRVVVDGHLNCTRCKKIMPLSAFHIDRSRMSGYGIYCRNCIVEKR
jgi:hypothetical protein